MENGRRRGSEGGGHLRLVKTGPSHPCHPLSGSYRTTQDSGWGARPARTPLPNPEDA